jgi:hypothetical protein
MEVKAEMSTFSRIRSEDPAPRASSTAATPSPKKSKKPLFRPASPSSSDDEVADELTSLASKLKLDSEPAPASPPQTSSAYGTPASVNGKQPASTAKQTTPKSVSKVDSPSSIKPVSKGKARAVTPEVERVYPTLQEPESESQAEYESEPVVKVEEPEPEMEAGPTQAEIADATYDPPDGRKMMLAETCDINLFDKATAMFMLQEANVLASLWLVSKQAYTCWLTVAGKDGFIWISTPVDGQLPIHFAEEQMSVIISFVNEKSGQNFTWLLRLKDHETYSRMNQAFTQGIFESSNGLGTWDKLKPDEQRYNRDVYTDDVEMTDSEPYVEEQDEEEDRPAQQFEEEELYSEEEEETEESTEDESEDERSRGKAKNSLLAVGYKGLSFVVRGDMIGVFENEKGSGKKLKVCTNTSRFECQR